MLINKNFIMFNFSQPESRMNQDKYGYFYLSSPSIRLTTENQAFLLLKITDNPPSLINPQHYFVRQLTTR